MLSKWVDKTVCLSLDRRMSRAMGIKAEAKKFGLDVQLFIAGDGETLPRQTYDHIDQIDCDIPVYRESTTYPTWHNRDNAYNAWLCHKKIVTHAYLEDVERLLLLEDDILFEEDFEEIFTKANRVLKALTWDMIYFGWYSNGHIEPVSDHVYNMNGGGGFHGVLINRTIMNEMCKELPIGPFDWIAGQKYHSKYKAYAIYPSIITQEDGYSFVEGSDLKKPARDKI